MLVYQIHQKIRASDDFLCLRIEEKQNGRGFSEFFSFGIENLVIKFYFCGRFFCNFGMNVEQVIVFCWTDVFYFVLRNGKPDASFFYLIV